MYHTLLSSSCISAFALCSLTTWPEWVCFRCTCRCLPPAVQGTAPVCTVQALHHPMLAATSSVAASPSSTMHSCWTQAAPYRHRSRPMPAVQGDTNRDRGALCLRLHIRMHHLQHMKLRLLTMMSHTVVGIMLLWAMLSCRQVPG